MNLHGNYYLVSINVMKNIKIFNVSHFLLKALPSDDDTDDEIVKKFHKVGLIKDVNVKW